jgi:hypothetical protein
MAPSRIGDPLTRRQLLASGVMAGAGVVLGGLSAAPPAVGRESWLRRSSYAGRIGDRFRARAAGGPTVTLRLEAIGDLTGTTRSGDSLAGRDDAFLLVLSGPDTPRLTQGIHELRHGTLGRAHLFLVPQARGELGNTYVVVVSRADRRS